MHGSGFKANYQDLTSKHRGGLTGVGNTVATLASTLGPLATAHVLHHCEILVSLPPHSFRCTRAHQPPVAACAVVIYGTASYARKRQGIRCPLYHGVRPLGLLGADPPRFIGLSHFLFFPFLFGYWGPPPLPSDQTTPGP